MDYVAIDDKISKIFLKYLTQKCVGYSSDFKYSYYDCRILTTNGEMQVYTRNDYGNSTNTIFIDDLPFDKGVK